MRECFADCVDVQVLRPGPPAAALFRQYLVATRGEVDEALAGLFAELVEECAP